ncbi:PaaI family thioesterase [Actinoplanes sp. NPDC051411]|uniref:PaaI family thioesterase n=1 Tax=Actinoplanes sp. NPDC051411 TaxID=3155522 RepID=UPI0034236329
MDRANAEPPASPRPEPDPRLRVVSWADQAAFSCVDTSSGLDFLQAMARGDIPPAPMMALLGMSLTFAAEGETVFRLTPEEFHYNPAWSLHGGVYASMLDSAAACAVHTTLPAGARFSTLDLSVRLVKPIDASTGPITATGKVVHAGRRVALAEARLQSAAGKLLATATASCFVVRP